MNVLNRIQYPSCPASFDQSQIKPLLGKVTFLIDFLEEGYSLSSSKVAEGLAQEMTDASQSAENLIESYIVDQIQSKFEGSSGMCYELFCQDLQKSIQRADLIIEDVIRIKENGCGNDDNLSRFSKPVAGSLLAAYNHKNTIIGFDEDMKHLLELLTDEQSSRQIIPIVGMGGIGKTTLAINVYNHSRILRCFHVRAWVTVSQNYDVRDIILCLLRDVVPDKDSILEDENECITNEELGGKLYKCLVGTKYLIILDDIWSKRVWDEIQMFLPNNNNGSRILVSTRQSKVALSVCTCSPYEMKLLDQDISWDLLREKVFGQDDLCPLELVEYGKKISRSCKGLPLTIVVIGGLLKRSHKTQEYWEEIAKKVLSIIDMDNDDYCLNILSLSYHHLPIHLKPCFLCLPYSRKGTPFKVSKISQGWIVNGILKPNRQKSLEEIALEYLYDLIDRNIIMVKMQGSNGKIKTCMVHDFFVDFGRREAKKVNFSGILKYGKIIHPKETKSEQHLDTLKATYSVRPGMPIINSVARSVKSNSSVHELRLLRVLTSYCEDSLQTVLPLYNARFLRLTKCRLDDDSRCIPSSISFLWNLDTLIINSSSSKVTVILPSEIWELPHLRHLVITKMMILPDPVKELGACVLKSLQKLKTVKNFNITDEVVKRIPNLMQLGISYDMLEVSVSNTSRYFSNLSHLHKLETLRCKFEYEDDVSACVFDKVENITLPNNLVKLSLLGSCIPWDNMSCVGLLPSLEVLVLQNDAFCGKEWNSNDGEFQQLKYLSIELCYIETWHADSSHFPKLEGLDLNFLELKEIPMGIGEINTLVSLKLVYCELSTIISAKEILEEQKNLGNEDLVLQVCPFPWHRHQEVMSSTDDNFRILTPTFDLSRKGKGDWEWLRLQAVRMFYLYAMAPLLSPGHIELENLISEISNDIFAVLKARCTQDDAITQGTVLFDCIILLHYGFHRSTDAQMHKNPTMQRRMCNIMIPVTKLFHI